MRRRWSIVPLALVALLSACGSSGSDDAEAPEPTRARSTPTTTSARNCDDSDADCTPAQVIARLRALYEGASATRTEAACLAPITGSDAHSVAEAFEAADAQETRAAVDCVGSAARLQKISNGLAIMAAREKCDTASAEARRLPSFDEFCAEGTAS